ncbi:hypothetical protein, partial [Escherichia coli]|uniref:hypothetical protein n=1 Tax=Escherichia coli TaxID=562 RepID=UPI00195FB9F6
VDCVHAWPACAVFLGLRLFFFARLYIVLTVITVIAAFVCSFRQSVIACQLLDRLASVISPNASSNTL